MTLTTGRDDAGPRACIRARSRVSSEQVKDDEASLQTVFASGTRPDIYTVTYLKTFNHEKEAVWRNSRRLYRLVPSRGSDR